MFSHEKLKKRRMELNLTQSSIYQELGISRKTYSAWENGLAEPHAKNLRRLATCLKVQENYFVDETSTLYTYPLLTPPHKKEVDQLASQLLERQRKVSSLTAYKVLSVELAAGRGHSYYDNETDYETVYFDQDIQHDFASWVSGDSTGAQVSQWLCCPYETDRIRLRWGSLCSYVEWQDLYQKSLPRS